MKSSLSSLKRECAAYTLLWQLYNFQSALGIGSIGQSLLAILVAYSLFRTVDVIRRYKFEPFMKGLTALFIMFTLYGVWHLFWGPAREISAFGGSSAVPTFYYLKYIYCSIPTVYVYYFFAKKGVFNSNNILWYILFFIVTTVPAFFHHYYTVDEINGNMEGVTNNVGYKFVPIMALALLISRWRIISIIELVSYMFIVFSLKRGAILIGTISLLAFLSVIIKTSKGLKKLRGLFIASAILFVAVYYVLNLYETNEEFQHRIAMTLEGNSSGRDQIAETILDAFNQQSDPFAIIFGNGADATIDIAGINAHNDWLELLINQGVIGVIVFFLFYVSWFRTYLSLRRTVPKNVSTAFGLALIGSIGSSIFSMAYTAFGPPISIVIGYALYLKSVYQTSDATCALSN